MDYLPPKQVVPELPQPNQLSVVVEALQHAEAVPQILIVPVDQ